MATGVFKNSVTRESKTGVCRKGVSQHGTEVPHGGAELQMESRDVEPPKAKYFLIPALLSPEISHMT